MFEVRLTREGGLKHYEKEKDPLLAVVNEEPCSGIASCQAPRF